MTEKPKLHLVQPQDAPDLLEALTALYAAVTGKEPTPDELEEARELLAGTERLPDECS